MKPKTTVVLALAFIVLIIMLQNTHTVTVRILFWQILLPQVFLIVLILVAGVSIGYLMGTLKAGGRK